MLCKLLWVYVLNQYFIISFFRANKFSGGWSEWEFYIKRKPKAAPRKIATEHWNQYLLQTLIWYEFWNKKTANKDISQKPFVTDRSMVPASILSWMEESKLEWFHKIRLAVLNTLFILRHYITGAGLYWLSKVKQFKVSSKANITKFSIWPLSLISVIFWKDFIY